MTEPLNPYQPPSTISDHAHGLVGDALLLKKSFLYRRIQFEHPFAATLTYNGWNFRQRIWLNNQIVWYRISWATFHRRAVFDAPAKIDPRELGCEVRIDFRPGLFIRNFMVLIDNEIIYDGD